MMNMPEVKLGIVAVSRDCFPITLSESRRKAVAAAYKGELYECPTVVESELDMQKALKEVQEAGCNALVVYLGNFGPETAETLLVKYFDGPCMVVAAAEWRQSGTGTWRCILRYAECKLQPAASQSESIYPGISGRNTGRSR